MNYTVLVVEDEYEQRRALIERVNWGGAGFEVIGEAENGVEALDLVESLEPDLIMTDIKMPMISGLELAARVRELRPATQMVILSGYDSFEYAQTAINYNIIRYLLKPISSAELSEELVDIRRRMDERLDTAAAPDADAKNQLHRMQVDEFLLPLMLGSNEEQPDDRELRARAEELGIVRPGSQPRFCVLVSKYKGESGPSTAGRAHVGFIDSVLARYLTSFSFVVYGRAITLVVTEQPGELSNLLELPLREMVQTSRRMRRERCTVGVSRPFDALSGCADAYFQAVTARRYTSDGAGEVRFIDDQEHAGGEAEMDHAEKTALKLEQLLKVGDRAALEKFVAGMFEHSTPENANLLVMQIIITVCRVVSNVADKTESAQLLSANPIFSRFTTYNSEAGVKNELIDFCERAKSLISGAQRRDSEVLCDRVVQIIDERYSDEELSLTGVSNELAVSPNYLSTLIKKTKKKNFVTLLTERRMKAAYDMLVCSGLRIMEIAEKCGYSDQHYFSYCFKKFYGDSPVKVRSTNRSEQG